MDIGGLADKVTGDIDTHTPRSDKGDIGDNGDIGNTSGAQFVGQKVRAVFGPGAKLYGTDDLSRIPHCLTQAQIDARVAAYGAASAVSVPASPKRAQR